jgi:hypothetical protein
MNAAAPQGCVIRQLDSTQDLGSEGVLRFPKVLCEQVFARSGTELLPQCSAILIGAPVVFVNH